MTEKTTVAIEKAFGKDSIVTLEDGEKIRIKKWSVRKAMVMGSTLARVVGEVFSLIDSKSEGGTMQVGDIVAMIPQVLESCADELTYIIVESTTLSDGKQQITKDRVMDQLSLDDFVDLLSSVIETNLTEKTMGKWKRLLKATPLGGN
jgi:hypothetical protein